MNPKPIVAALVVLLGSVFPAATRGAETFTVFAAASLTESLKEMGEAFQRKSGDTAVFNFAASGPLRRQIEEGAPADVFFSADEATMNALEGKGLIVAGTRQSRLSNRLVVVIAADSPLKLASARDLASVNLRRLAIGEPKTVPAGAYAKEYLVALGIWAALETRVVPCDNVRAVLAAVESGNVDAGIVYKTDAGISRAAKVALEVPAREGPRISYPVALVRDSKHPEAAGRFLAFLASAEAGRIFERRGFALIEAQASGLPPGGQQSP